MGQTAMVHTVGRGYQLRPLWLPGPATCNNQTCRLSEIISEEETRQQRLLAGSVMSQLLRKRDWRLSPVYLGYL